MDDEISQCLDSQKADMPCQGSDAFSIGDGLCWEGPHTLGLSMWKLTDLEEVWFSANCSTSRCVVATSGGGLCQWSRGISEGQKIQHFRRNNFHQISRCAWPCSIDPGLLGLWWWWFDCGGASELSQHLRHHQRKLHGMYPTARRCDADCHRSSRQGPVICNLTIAFCKASGDMYMICNTYA